MSEHADGEIVVARVELTAEEIKIAGLTNEWWIFLTELNEIAINTDNPTADDDRGVIAAILATNEQIGVENVIRGAALAFNDASDQIKKLEAKVRDLEQKDRELVELRGRLEAIGRKAFWSARA